MQALLTIVNDLVRTGHAELATGDDDTMGWVGRLCGVFATVCAECLRPQLICSPVGSLSAEEEAIVASPLFAAGLDTVEDGVDSVLEQLLTYTGVSARLVEWLRPRN